MSTNQERLEQALCQWESLCFITSRILWAKLGFAGKKAELSGVYRHFPEFRRFLLSRNPVFNSEDFLPPDDVLAKSETQGGWFLLPEELHTWSNQSRRIYTLSSEVQQFLEITSIAKLTWNDVSFPFSSFGIALPVPIRNYGENCIWDFILVTRRPSKYGHLFLDVRLIGTHKNFQPLSKKAKQRIDQALEKGKFEKAWEYLEELRDTLLRRDSQTTFFRYQIDKERLNTPVVDTFSHIQTSDKLKVEASHEEQMRSAVLSTSRIIIGLCLYLESTSRPSKTRDTAELKWDKHPLPTTDPKSLLSESQVCLVSGKGILTSDEARLFELIQKVGLAKAVKEMGVHFRCAYWRRPPGKGDDILASKTVRVKSTVVRPDRLPPGEGLPPGSGVTVT